MTALFPPNRAVGLIKAPFAVLSLALVFGACGDSTSVAARLQSDRPPPEVQRVRLDDVVDQAARYVGHGRALSSHENLAAVVDEVLTVDGVRTDGVSSEAVISRSSAVPRRTKRARGSGSWRTCSGRPRRSSAPSPTIPRSTDSERSRGECRPRISIPQSSGSPERLRPGQSGSVRPSTERSGSSPRSTPRRT